MSPQGRSPDGTGVPTWVDHNTAPVSAASAYTVSFSVATKTRPVASSGSPYTWPSSTGDVHAGFGGLKVTPEVSAPVPSGLPWYTVHEEVASTCGTPTAAAWRAATPVTPSSSVIPAQAVTTMCSAPRRREIDGRVERWASGPRVMDAP